MWKLIAIMYFTTSRHQACLNMRMLDLFLLIGTTRSMKNLGLRKRWASIGSPRVDGPAHYTVVYTPHVVIMAGSMLSPNRTDTRHRVSTFLRTCYQVRFLFLSKLLINRIIILGLLVWGKTNASAVSLHHNMI